jgi:hypothetical protein
MESSQRTQEPTTTEEDGRGEEAKIAKNAYTMISHLVSKGQIQHVGRLASNNNNK